LLQGAPFAVCLDAAAAVGVTAAAEGRRNRAPPMAAAPGAPNGKPGTRDAFGALPISARR